MLPNSSPPLPPPPPAELQKHHRARQQFQQQQHENEMVLKELELLDEDAKVYKQIGPTLVRQDHVEATSNVSKRLEFIGSELKRIDEKIAALEEKGQKRQAAIEKLQAEATRMGRAAGAPVAS